MNPNGTEKRIIKVKPEFLAIKSPTRKKREANIKPKVADRSTLKKKMSKEILNMLRNHRNKDPLPEKKEDKSTIAVKGEVEQSLQFLHKMKDQIDIPKIQPNMPPIILPPKIHNQTLRAVIPIKQESPPYGCLRNGAKPTYRTWINQTQKTKPPVELPLSESMKIYEQKLNEKQIEQEKRTPAILCVEKQPRRHRKIKRRTFCVGKSTQYPIVTVLVSNKTIRNKTNLKKIELKETPMHEVKRFLVKQGLIKVGTTTPNDVLRQMYESAQLLCGEVKNYNSENLLHNYLHDDSDLMDPL